MTVDEIVAWLGQCKGVRDDDAGVERLFELLPLGGDALRELDSEKVRQRVADPVR